MLQITKATITQNKRFKITFCNHCQAQVSMIIQINGLMGDQKTTDYRSRRA